MDPYGAAKGGRGWLSGFKHLPEVEPCDDVGGGQTIKKKIMRTMEGSTGGRQRGCCQSMDFVEVRVIGAWWILLASLDHGRESSP